MLLYSIRFHEPSSSFWDLLENVYLHVLLTQAYKHILLIEHDNVPYQVIVKSYIIHHGYMYNYIDIGFDVDSL